MDHQTRSLRVLSETTPTCIRRRRHVDMRSEEGRMMWCPHCESADTNERRERTALGYRRFRCRTCQREFNERTGTSFNHLQYPTDVVCLVVLWRGRGKISF